MSHHCHDHCHSGSHSHGSHEHSCCSDQHHHHCCCHNDNCDQQKEAHHHGDFSHELLEMADEAWMDLLKEKIKQKIEVLSGKHLDELADLVATSNHKRWVDKMAVRDAHEDYEDKVAEFFSRHS